MRKFTVTILDTGYLFKWTDDRAMREWAQHYDAVSNRQCPSAEGREVFMEVEDLFARIKQFVES